MNLFLFWDDIEQVACRDYPHPRHTCAKYLFSKTPHDKHCELVKMFPYFESFDHDNFCWFRYWTLLAVVICSATVMSVIYLRLVPSGKDRLVIAMHSTTKLGTRQRKCGENCPRLHKASNKNGVWGLSIHTCQELRSLLSFPNFGRL